MRFSDALNQYLFVIVIVLIAAAAGIFLISKSVQQFSFSLILFSVFDIMLLR